MREYKFVDSVDMDKEMLKRELVSGVWEEGEPVSLAWPRPFPRRLVGGAGGGEEGRRVW